MIKLSEIFKWKKTGTGVGSEPLRHPACVHVDGESPLPEAFYSAIIQHAEKLLADCGTVAFSPPELIHSKFTVLALSYVKLPRILITREPDLARGATPEALVSSFNSAPKLQLDEKDAHALCMRYARGYTYPCALLTDFCNLRCTMCPYHSEFQKGTRKKRKPGILPLDVYKRFVDQLPYENGILLSAAGEVYTLPNLHEYVRYAVKKLDPARVVVGTNGCFLTERNIEELLALNVGTIAISVEGITKEWQESHRPGSNFESIIDSIIKLKAMRDQRNAKTQIGINCVYDPLLAPMRDEIIEFWRDKSDYLLFLAKRENFTAYSENPFISFSETLPCFAPIGEGPVLCADGLITPCCTMALAEWHADMPWLRHINDESVDAAMDAYRRMLIEPSSEMYRFCQNCHFWGNSYAADKPGASLFTGYSEVISFL